MTKSSSQCIAYLGPEGTYTQTAALVFSKNSNVQSDYLACASIEDVFNNVACGNASHGVVPVENSTEGAINTTQDCLIHNKSRIIAEIVLPIEHNLLVSRSVRHQLQQSQNDGSRVNLDFSSIQSIYSHRQALAQCRQWLNANIPHAIRVECSSNAVAAAKVADEDQGAAIAGITAAELYKLDVAAAGIQDEDHNSTRFLVLAKQAVERSGNDKTSIVVYADNKPGALFRVLEPFEKLGLSLTKIETRPSRKEAWDYLFFIDFEGHADDDKVIDLFMQLQKCTAEVTLLGSYPRA